MEICCPTCGQQVVRSPILQVGAMRYDGDNWTMDGWGFGQTANVAGWTLEELSQIAVTKEEIEAL